jgi:hypothetical protein
VQGVESGRKETSGVGDIRYGVTRLVLDCSDFVELTREEYEEALTARTCLFVVLGMEEKFNLLLENYAEFEQELQTLTLRHALFHNFDWSSLGGELQTINRRLANLLSACRLYIDQVKHDVSTLDEDGAGQFQQLKKAFNTEYDGHLSYRALEALRGWVQHRSLPIHRLTYDAKKVDTRKGPLHRWTCTPSMSVKRIDNEGCFKTKVLDELKTIGDDLVDLKPMVRDYVAALGRVQCDLRQRMRSDVDEWERKFGSIQRRFREAYGATLVGLALVCIDNAGAICESASVFDDVVKRRKSLERKNRHVAHVRSHYVSTEVLGDTAGD